MKQSGCISDFKLDQWAAGELDDEAMRELELHLSSCERCVDRRRALAGYAQQYLANFPDPPRGRSTRPASWWLASGSVLAAAAAFALWLGTPQSAEVTRAKGGPRLEFYVKHGAQVRPGHDGERVQAGDRLRFVLTTTEPRHVGIFGRDASGTSFVYYPDGTHSVAVGVVRQHAIDSSVELDETLGEERVFGFFCERQFELAPVAKSLQSGAAARSGCTVETLRLVKGAQR